MLNLLNIQSFTSNRLPIAVVALCVFVFKVNSTQAALLDSDAKNSRALSVALSQAVDGYPNTSQRVNTLIWLSTMSERLEKRVPDPFYRVRLLHTILEESRAAGLNPQLVLAVIDVESSFNRQAVSKSGALGLMQVMPFWKEVYSRPDDNLLNPLVSIRYGCNVLRHYMDRYDNVRNALAAYNGSLGWSTYPDLVIARYKKNWRYDVPQKDPLSLAANTLNKTSPVDELGELVLPASQALLADLPAPLIYEVSQPAIDSQSEVATILSGASGD